MPTLAQYPPMHNFIMSAQEAVETSLGRLRKVIEQKEEQPIVGTRITLDWKAGEITLYPQFTDVGVIDAMVNLQKEAGKQRIGCFYTFFIMQKTLKAPLTPSILDQQTALLSQKQSKYHTLKAFISMREHLLSKINKFSGTQAKVLFEDVDDIRFLNFQIINGIQKWKEEWRVQGHPEPAFYEGNTNYLLKISNDNADMINLANFKKTKFISPPNPFFLTEDGNLQGMTGKQKQDIADCMQVINKERAIDLRMAVSGDIFLHKPRAKPKGGKNAPSVKKEPPVEKSFVSLAKNELLSGKEEQIRKIYKINRSLQSTKNKAQLERISNINIIKVSNEQRDQEKLKMYSSEKRLKSNPHKNPRQTITKDANPVQAKLSINKISFSQNPVEQSKASKASNGIRNEISKFVKDLQSQSPVKKREVREMKPKIKLIEEKSTVVAQEQVKAIFNMTASNVRPLSRQSSTFYKKIEPIAEQAEDAPMPTTQKNFSKRSLSQSNFYQKEQKKQKQKQVIKPQVNLQSSILSKQADSKSQIRSLSSRIKNLTIINIYKGKKDSKKPRNNSLQAINVQDSHAIPKQRPIASSFITEIREIQPKIDSSKFTATIDKRKAANSNEISKLSQQLQKKSLKSRRNEQILQDKQANRLLAQKELQLKSIVITDLQQKINQLQEQRATNRKKAQPSKIHTKQYQRSKKMRQIQSKILKDKITSEEQKFMEQRELKLKLKQQTLKKELKKNLKELQADTIKKRKDYEKQILQEEHRMKETERQINKEKSRYKEIESELQQKRLKEKLLRKIMEEKEAAAVKHYQTEIEVEKSLQIERGLREKMERQSLQLLQEQKRKMEALYQQMIQKNKRIQEENSRKMAQLNELDERRANQIQKMKELQQQFRKTFTKEEPSTKPENTQSQSKEPNSMQDLKLKLKKELLQQILAKQQRQEQEQHQQQQRRRQRLKRIQEEVARTLKAQEENLQRENAQFLKKIEQLKEMTLIPSTHQSPQQEQRQQAQPKQEQKAETQGEHVSNIKNPVTFQLKPVGTDDSNQVQRQMKKLQQAIEPQKQQERPSQTPVQDKENAELQRIQPPKIKKPQQHPQQKTQDLASESPILQNYPQQQSRPQDGQKQQQDLKQKYKSLSKCLKKTKPLTVQPNKTSQFLDSFISSLQKPVREMLPWNKFDLERIMGTKEVDTFEHSIGWLQGGKYHLIGNQEGVQNIGKKHGPVAIHQVFIFDKNNPYQKQYLTKKMKTFESIGFVFQKKLQEGNKYSIRFVIKLPRDVFKPIKKEPEERVKQPSEHDP